MQIIREGRSDILKIWGNASLKDVEYRLIQYHVRSECKEGTLLLNTITGELLLLEPTEAKVLEFQSNVVNSVMEELIAKRFLVPKDYDERKVVDQLRNLYRKLKEGNRIGGYNILPTTACNARCFYCYESDYEHCTMTAEIADKLVDYIESHCGDEKKVTLSWFGGEPTVGEARIDQICDRLTEKGIRYTSSMISNSYLFSKDMVQKAVDKWKLQSIQITLDGTEEVYNRTKAYVNAESSPFHRVIRNIGLLLEQGVRVVIRMNLDFHNEEDLRTLIEELAEQFSGKGKLVMYVHTLFENTGFQPFSHSDHERRHLIYKENELNELIRANGFPREDIFALGRLPSLRIPYCMADNPSTIQVNPLGQFCKCEHEIFSYLVGDLDNGFDTRSEQSLYWLNPKYKQECTFCKLYPFCGKILPCIPESKCYPEQKEVNIGAAVAQMIHYYQKEKNKTEKENTYYDKTCL